MYDAMQFLAGHAILLFFKILLYEMVGHIDQRKRTQGNAFHLVMR